MHLSTRIRAIVGVALTALALGACSSPQSAPASSPEASAMSETSATRTVTDASGQEVTLPSHPSRVVTLSEPTTDNALALGITPIGVVSGRGQQTVPNYLVDRAGDIPILGSIGTPNLEAIGAALLALVFVPQFGADGIFISVFISISSFCNAGFDILGRVMPGGSVIPYQSNPYVLAVISLLIISGGLGFLVWQDLSAYHRTHHLRTHTKLVLWITGWLLLLGTAGILFMEYNNPLTLGPMNLFDKITNAAFQSVSARTAGYNSIPLGDMTNFTKIFMSLLMFIGAAPGGTGGGIKVTTLSVVLLAVASVVRGRDEAMIFGRRIDHKTVYKSLTILMLSLFAVIAASMTLFYNTGPELNEVNSVFEAVSAFGTVGLSVGVTPLMNPFARVVTMLTMFIGRVGPVSLAISLSARKDSAAARRAVQPQAHINVG